MVQLIFDPEALLEIREAVAFYEQSKPGLGKSFLTVIEKASLEISQHPLFWRQIKGKFRRYLILGFPYGIIYAVEKNTVYIAAIMHLKRKPGYWIARARNR
ncbi:MAG: hypothetical protein A2293_10155 [Elusimicrobia bacterium RIFOXYB2_FULL_49_7]|nr:MAG: hypothetical protein A2293_10155 [Elusimicrobia bacterium RIFOXYB2_FULL_49_7]